MKLTDICKINEELDNDPGDMPDISIEEHPFNAYKKGAKEYVAVDLHSYDGAPDGGNMVGHGSTPKEAALDLCDQLISHDVWSKESCELALHKLNLQ